MPPSKCLGIPFVPSSLSDCIPCSYPLSSSLFSASPLQAPVPLQDYVFRVPPQHGVQTMFSVSPLRRFQTLKTLSDTADLQAQIRAQRAHMERDPHYDAPNLSLATPEARPFEAPKHIQNFLQESSARPMPVERKSFDIQSSLSTNDRRSLKPSGARKKSASSGIW